MPDAPLHGQSVSRSKERFVVLLDTMNAIADHALDVDCDYECAAWMNGRAVEALTIFFGGDDWTNADFEAAKAAIRS